MHINALYLILRYHSIISKVLLLRALKLKIVAYK